MLTTLCLALNRSVSISTHRAITRLLHEHGASWEYTDVEMSPVSRARCFAASEWYRKSTTDVLLMVDDDMSFRPEDATRIAGLCHDGYDVIGAAYPYRNASGIAVRPTGDDELISFGDNLPPKEVRHVGTGFLAIHRRVIGTMVEQLDFVTHGRTDATYWPLFAERLERTEDGVVTWPSEDASFCLFARDLGFHVWVDCATTTVRHVAAVEVGLPNMQIVRAALQTSDGIA